MDLANFLLLQIYAEQDCPQHQHQKSIDFVKSAEKTDVLMLVISAELQGLSLAALRG